MKLNSLNSKFNLIKYHINIALLLIIIGCGSNSAPSTPNSPNNPKVTVIMGTDFGGIANGATNTSTTPIIVLQFSEAMKLSTCNAQSIMISTNQSGQNPIPTTSFTTDPTSKIIAFAPMDNLKANTNYYVVVTGTPQSITGDNTTSQIFSFNTGTSATPMIALLNPAPNTASASLSPVFEAVLSQQITGFGLNAVKLVSASPAENIPLGSAISSNSGYTYTFSPLSTQLLPNTVYSLSFSSVISGQSPINQLTFNFTTSNSQPVSNPTVLSTTPTNGSKNITANTNVPGQVQFSQSMNVSTITPANIIVTSGSPNGSPIEVTSVNVVPNTNNTVFNIMLASLSFNTEYYITFSPDITSSSGAPLSPPALPYSFTTAASPVAPTVTALIPSNNQQLIPANISQFTFQFNEAVTNVSIANVTITANPASFTPDITITSSNNQYNVNIINLPSSLPYNTTYSINFGNGITAISSGIALQPTQFSFSTESKIQLQSPNGLVIYNNYLYVFSYTYYSDSGSISSCEIEPTTGAINSCNSIVPSGTISSWPGNITGITFDNNNNVYIGFDTLGGASSSGIYKCTVSNFTAFTNCNLISSEQIYGLSPIFTTTTLTDLMYVSVPNGLNICNNATDSCTSSGISTSATPTQGLVIGSFFYLGSDYNSPLEICALDNSTGNLSNCNTGSSVYTENNGITAANISSTNYLYVAGAVGGLVGFAIANGNPISNWSAGNYSQLTNLNAPTDLVYYSLSTISGVAGIMYISDINSGIVSACNVSDGTSAAAAGTFLSCSPI
jgi:hypothetical protein